MSPPVPKVLRSRAALVSAGLAEPTGGALPITEGGTTYEMAQEARWLDGSHFAIGRWDGSMSIFEFQSTASVGPVISQAVNSPACAGVQMLAPCERGTLAASNDNSSIALWRANGSDWATVAIQQVCPYDPAWGAASAGIWTELQNQSVLVVGHIAGYLSLWALEPNAPTLEFMTSVDVRNPHPVNPWGDHTIEDLSLLTLQADTAVVVAGSEDGFVTLLDVPSGEILSQTVFNPQAQRGINAVAISEGMLLIANCAVGAADHNLWYYGIDEQNWSVNLIDEVDLAINTGLPQVFNFDVEWGQFSGGRCWFASTEEGALWMGTADNQALSVIGYEPITGPLGSALAYREGKLAMSAYDIYQFLTLA